MRWIALLSAVLVLAAVEPAWAYLETQPGDEEWPEIPGRMGMKAFEGTWFPLCNVGVFFKARAMTVHDDGRITYARNKVLPVRFRVIEATPHYVVTLAQAPTLKGNDIDVYFWAFRPLGKSFTPLHGPGMSVIGVNECPVYGDADRKRAIWNFSNAELAEFWRTNKFCHPSLTPKIEGGSYWGGRWGQACWFSRDEP